MKNVVLICEKPSLSKVIIDELLFVEPDMDHATFALGWANEFYNLNTAFQFRRGESYSSFPKVQEPSYKPLSFQGQYLESKPVLRARRGISIEQLKPNGYSFDAEIDDSSFRRAVQLADVVYIAIDCGPSGFHTRKRILEWISLCGGSFEIKHIILSSMDARSVHQSVKSAGDIPDLEERAKLSVVRRYFDYNYLLNAYPIMGMTSERALGRRLDWPLTKHELQVLYHVRQVGRISDGGLFDDMQKWKGTGRYSTKGWPDYFGVGNPASRWHIIDNLVQQGLLSRPERARLEISPDGMRLLHALHPDCHDPDQVLRLYAWAQLPLEEAKSKINRYIRTFFGKQKRYLSSAREGQSGS